MDIPEAIIAVFDYDFDAIKNMSNEKLIETDSMGRNAAHAACYNGYVDILVYLMNNKLFKEGCHLNKTDNEGNTLAHYCCGAEWKSNQISPTPLSPTKRDDFAG